MQNSFVEFLLTCYDTNNSKDVKTFDLIGFSIWDVKKESLCKSRERGYEGEVD